MTAFYVGDLMGQYTFQLRLRFDAIQQTGGDVDAARGTSKGIWSRVSHHIKRVGVAPQMHRPSREDGLTCDVESLPQRIIGDDLVVLPDCSSENPSQSLFCSVIGDSRPSREADCACSIPMTYCICERREWYSLILRRKMIGSSRVGEKACLVPDCDRKRHECR